MEGSRQVLVKVMLFQLQEHFHPHDGATPNFFNESRSSLLVLSIDVSFVSKFLWKGDKNFENQTSGHIYMEDPVSTVAPRLLHTPSREERRFLNFNHLSKEFLEQMIPHLKALI